MAKVVFTLVPDRVGSALPDEWLLPDAAVRVHATTCRCLTSCVRCTLSNQSITACGVMDPDADPDPSFFITDLQDANKKTNF